MNTTKPQGKLHSRFRHTCLGISAQAYRRLSQVVGITALYLIAVARTRKDNVSSLSVLTQNAWDKFKPTTPEENAALFFHCGVLYQETDNMHFIMAAEAAVDSLFEKQGWSEDFVKGGANFEEFYAAAEEAFPMGESLSPEELDRLAAEEDLTGETIGEDQKARRAEREEEVEVLAGTLVGEA